MANLPQKWHDYGTFMANIFLLNSLFIAFIFKKWQKWHTFLIVHTGKKFNQSNSIIKKYI